MHKHLINRTIELAGDTWKVMGVGYQDEGKLYCHLASTTRFRQQRNGQVPVQIADLVDIELLEAA